MRFFLDTNMPYATLKVFEKLSLEATHAKDVGLNMADDIIILDHAAKTKSIIVTKDIEFGTFPATSHCVVIVLRLPYFYKADQITNSLKEFLKLVNLKDLENSITVIKPGNYRIRKAD